MDTPSLPPGLIPSLPVEVVALLTSQSRRIDDLQRRLGQNPSNSSMPPPPTSLTSNAAEATPDSAREYGPSLQASLSLTRLG